jgi:hypothetical protein
MQLLFSLALFQQLTIDWKMARQLVQVDKCYTGFDMK